jgi:predicted phage terminase large subunit-like protein
MLIPEFSPEEIEILKLQISTLKAEASLYEFFKQSWPILGGKEVFVDSWHVQAVAEHLEACFERKIKRLLINIPPRSGKTNLISIAFPAWVWLRNPEEKFMYASYASRISSDQSLACKRLIESDWYQNRWSDKFHLSRDQKTKNLFDNNAGGFRFSTSVGGSATGRGADILVADDPNNVKEGVGTSIVKLENAISWWDQVWSTRLNNPKEGVKIVVQQRMHEKDISGHIMADEGEDDWVKLILPMKFENSRRATTVVLPSTNNAIWTDPRTEDGELLCPERFPIDVVKRLETQLGSYGAAGQLQQRPSPEDGGLIKRDWFKWWKEESLPEFQFIVQSWDTALSAKEMAAYSACTTWGVFYDHNYIENIMLLSMWRGRVEYPELRERAKRLYFDYRDVETDHNPLFKGRLIDMCLIEAKASGDPLIRDLALAGIIATPFDPTKRGDKISRVRFITPLIEGGRIWLPARGPRYERLLPFADTFVESVISFPNSDSRDLVDTMTQVLSKMKEGGYLRHPKDELPIPEDEKDIRYY